MSNSKGFSQIATIISILAVVVIIIGGGVFWIMVQQTDTNQNTNTVSNTNTANTNISNSNATANANIENQNMNASVNENANTSANQNANISVNTSSDPTADWKIYRNEKYGFEVRYPSSWKYNEKTSYTVVGFLPESPTPATPDYTYIRVKIYDNQDDLTIQNFYKTIGPVIDTDGGRLFKDYQSDGTLSIGNEIVAERFNSIPGAVLFTWIIFSTNSKIFEFMMPNDNSYPSVDTQTILNQLIKTFRNI